MKDVRKMQKIFDAAVEQHCQQGTIDPAELVALIELCECYDAKTKKCKEHIASNGQIRQEL